ncbi:MAG: DNA alkylation repair protein [Phenylobacterium sp.]|nr:DNA alkylation repair protein [Phenylobacterium sp.]
MAALEAEASAKVLAEMGPRYGLVVEKALGVPMARMQAVAKALGRDHDLAEALWITGWYEARIVACLVDDPALVTVAQMDRWRADFDNWGVVDTVCFKLFDQVEGAPAVALRWCGLNDEFGRRAGFALLACLALHGGGEETDFLEGLRLIEACATDERNFVKKGVNWALRAIGGKANARLRAEARAVAARLAASTDRTARWNGKDAAKGFARADAKGGAG